MICSADRKASANIPCTIFGCEMSIFPFFYWATFDIYIKLTLHIFNHIWPKLSFSILKWDDYLSKRFELANLTIIIIINHTLVVLCRYCRKTNEIYCQWKFCSCIQNVTLHYKCFFIMFIKTCSSAIMFLWKYIWCCKSIAFILPCKESRVFGRTNTFYLTKVVNHNLNFY